MRIDAAAAAAAVVVVVVEEELDERLLGRQDGRHLWVNTENTHTHAVDVIACAQ